MTRFEKLLDKILRGTSDKNVTFDELSSVLLKLGFEERVRASHHIFTRTGVEEILNLQPETGGRAKPYQVKQVREVTVKYKLGGSADEE